MPKPNAKHKTIKLSRKKYNSTLLISLINDYGTNL